MQIRSPSILAREDSLQFYAPFFLGIFNLKPHRKNLELDFSLHFTMQDSQETTSEVSCDELRHMAKHELRFLVAFHILLGFSSTLANAVILAALSKESCLHPPSKILLRSLALTDLCVGLLLEPLFVSVVIMTENDNLKLCASINLISSFITEVFCLVSLVTLTAISLDRLLALLLGITYRQVVTFKRTLMSMTCMWTLIVSLASMIFWKETANLYYITIVVLLCIMVSTCSYIKIYQKLLHHQAQIQEPAHQGQQNGHIPLNIARYRKTLCSALWVQFSVLVCYLPMGIVMALIIIRGANPSLLVAWRMAATLMLLNSTLNPILYCWKIADVRRAVMDIIGQIFCCLSN